MPPEPRYASKLSRIFCSHRSQGSKIPPWEQVLGSRWRQVAVFFPKMTKNTRFCPFLTILTSLAVLGDPFYTQKVHFTPKIARFFLRKWNLGHVHVRKKLFDCGFWKTIDNRTNSATFPAVRRRSQKNRPDCELPPPVNSLYHIYIAVFQMFMYGF